VKTVATSGPEARPQGGFEPKIVAFCCYYCAYSAADLAGSMRLQYPANIRIIEVPCSGKVDPVILLKAFEEGADGVYVAGCLEGDCHFLKGNYRAKRRVAAVKKILDQIGMDGRRLEMFNLSAAMGTRFAEIAQEMTNRIKEIGPSPIRPEAMASRRAASAAAAGGAAAQPAPPNAAQGQEEVKSE
jgi:coenzyme F420-reducing hydrogenase delta subunit